MATKNLFHNLVFVSATISAITLSAPSIKRLVVEQKWSGEDTWVVLAALGSTIATTWVRYLDEDGTLHTPRGIPGRNAMLTMVDVAEVAGSVTSNFLDKKQ